MGIRKIEMSERTQKEFNEMMNKLQRVRSKVIRNFCTKAYDLNVGEEMFQCHIACLPDILQLKSMLNDKSSTMKFEVYQTINGTMVKRLA